MAKGHPTDEQGRILPDSAWPDDRHAPEPLELVRRFCNTVNRENGADRFSSIAGFAAWIAAQDLPPTVIDASDLDRLIRLREALHRLAAANAHPDDTTPRDVAAAQQELSDLVAAVRFKIATDGAALTLTAAGSGAEALVGQLLLATVAAQADGTWPRLKACCGCEWVVYDRSKNRSARWCSMRACGGRYKVRAYRARHAP